MSRTLRALTAPAILCAGLALTVSGCSSLIEKSYRIDVRQGNYVSQNMVSQLSPGMTEEQVRFIMGSPLLIDPFHTGRWDYVYRFAPGHGPVEERHITLLFDNGKLAKIEGDVVAAKSGAPGVEPGTPRVVDIGAASTNQKAN